MMYGLSCALLMARCHSSDILLLSFLAAAASPLAESAQKHDLSLLSDVVGYEQYLKPLVQRAKADRNGHNRSGASHPAGDAPADHELADTV
jgi:hypothetical protein